MSQKSWNFSNEDPHTPGKQTVSVTQHKHSQFISRNELDFRVNYLNME